MMGLQMFIYIMRPFIFEEIWLKCLNTIMKKQLHKYTKVKKTTIFHLKFNYGKLVFKEHVTDKINNIHIEKQIIHATK
jgi:hypothetical protein